MMTLAEALASGRPFKRMQDDTFCDDNKLSYTFSLKQAHDPIWQILPEEQPLMRVWYDVTAHSSPITVCEIQPSNQHMEMSKALAAALAPHLKDLLK